MKSTDSLMSKINARNRGGKSIKGGGHCQDSKRCRPASGICKAPALYTDYGKSKKQVVEYGVIKKNIDSILRQDREPERNKENDGEKAIIVAIFSQKCYYFYKGKCIFI